MTFFALLRLALINQLKVMRQMHHVVVFEVINGLLAAIAEQQSTPRRPLGDISGNNCIVASLAIRFRVVAPCFDAGVDIKSLTR